MRLAQAWMVVAVGALLLGGCKEKVKGAIERYAPRFDQKYQLLSKAASELPNEKDDKELTGPPLDPKPLFTEDARGNAEIMSVELFVDNPNATHLQFPDRLRSGLLWARGVALPHDRLGQPAESIVPELEGMLAVRYVVLTRINSNHAAAPAADGMVDLQGFLVDLADGKVKRAVRVLSTVPAGSSYELQPQAAHDDLLDALAEKIGTVEIKRLAPDRPKVALKAPAALPWVTPPENPGAPPAVVDLHASSAQVAATNVKRAVELMAAGQDPANVCKAALVLAQVNRFEPALTDEVRRVCMRDASLFWAKAALAKETHPAPATCARIRPWIGFATGAEGHAAVADRYYAACK